MIVAPQLQLPSAPAHLTGAVKAWSEPVSIPSALGEALHDRVWGAVHIENEFFRLLILPELNGCIYLALDKTTDTDFFQRSSVIGSEPVGLNFVWPRAAITDIFLPADTKIEEHPDGSQTVWCSRYDPLTRMKGMHGICLQPGRSYIQVKVRLYNRTPLTQTYAWQPEAALANKDKLRIVHIAGERTVDPEGYAYLAPYETRSLNEYWYAIATPDNGEPVETTADAAVILIADREIVRVGVYVTRAFNGLSIRLMQGKTVLAQWSRDLSPRTPFA